MLFLESNGGMNGSWLIAGFGGKCHSCLSRLAAHAEQAEIAPTARFRRMRSVGLDTSLASMPSSHTAGFASLSSRVALFDLNATRMRRKPVRFYSKNRASRATGPRPMGVGRGRLPKVHDGLSAPDSGAHFW